MLGWPKKRVFDWIDEWQRREIARLHEEGQRLMRELEESGETPELTEDDRRCLAKAARGIDPQQLREISFIDPEQFMPPPEKGSI